MLQLFVGKHIFVPITASLPRPYLSILYSPTRRRFSSFLLFSFFYEALKGRGSRVAPPEATKETWSFGNPHRSSFRAQIRHSRRFHAAAVVFNSHTATANSANVENDRKSRENCRRREKNLPATSSPRSGYRDCQNFPTRSGIARIERQRIESRRRRWLAALSILERIPRERATLSGVHPLFAVQGQSGLPRGQVAKSLRSQRNRADVVLESGAYPAWCPSAWPMHSHSPGSCFVKLDLRVACRRFVIPAGYVLAKEPPPPSSR